MGLYFSSLLFYFGVVIFAIRLLIHVMHLLNSFERVFQTLETEYFVRPFTEYPIFACFRTYAFSCYKKTPRLHGNRFTCHTCKTISISYYITNLYRRNRENFQRPFLTRAHRDISSLDLLSRHFTTSKHLFPGICTDGEVNVSIRGQWAYLPD